MEVLRPWNRLCLATEVVRHEAITLRRGWVSLLSLKQQGICGVLHEVIYRLLSNDPLPNDNVILKITSEDKKLGTR